MFKNIIFDWTGVINENVIPAHCASMKVFGQFGVPEISIEEFKAEWEQPYMLFYHKYLPKSLTLEEENILFDKALKQCPKPNIYPGAADFIRKLQVAGKNMLVISSDPTFALEADLKRYQLTDIFKEIRADIHDKIITTKDIININNLVPDETAIIGDTTHEVEAGKKNGITTIAVTWGFQIKDKLQSANPDYLVDDFNQLEIVLLG